MNSALLDIVQGENGSYYFENAAESLIYTLIGIAVVFVGIALLIAILYLVGFIIKKIEKAKLSVGKNKASAVPQDGEATADADVPDEVKAAIVAAIMVYYSKEKPQCGFVVRKIKRL